MVWNIFEQRWCDNQTNINKDGVIIKQRWFDNQTNMNKDGMKLVGTKIDKDGMIIKQIWWYETFLNKDEQRWYEKLSFF